jgi:hypothetical protein
MYMFDVGTTSYFNFTDCPHVLVLFRFELRNCRYMPVIFKSFAKKNFYCFIISVKKIYRSSEDVKDVNEIHFSLKKTFFPTISQELLKLIA